MRFLICLLVCSCSAASGVPPGPPLDDLLAIETPPPTPEVSPCAPVRPFECSDELLDELAEHLAGDDKRPRRPSPPTVEP